MDARGAPTSADGSPENGDRRTADYYIYCSNAECVHASGSFVGDMECPPEWARHDEA